MLKLPVPPVAMDYPAAAKQVIISATLKQNTCHKIFAPWKHEKNPQEWKKSSIINQMRNQEAERLWLRL